MGLTVIGGRPARATSDVQQLREAVTAVSRALEDQNWTNLSQDTREEGLLTYDDRKALIRRARLYSQRNPLGIQACSLLVNYVLGQGITLTAAEKTRVARVVDEFWENPVNRAVFTSHDAMSEFLVGAFTDAAQYLVLFPDDDEGTVEMGTIDAVYVEDVITDPQNSRITLWYKVRKPKGTYDYKNGLWVGEPSDTWEYYRHWRNDSDKHAPPEKMRAKGLMYQAKRGKGKFGQSGFKGAIDWLAAHKGFMEDRATLTRAAAAIAWRKKRKNATASDISGEVERLRSTLSRSITGQGYDTNPPGAAGSTVVENENSTMEWVKTDTGGSSALADERIMRMMAGSSLGGIPNHYFGDEASANLATATAMELPLLKSYENWQTWLSDIVTDVLGFVLETAHEAGRIGPKDTERKYTDRALTAEKVIDQYGGDPAKSTQPPTPEKETPFGEADVTVKVVGGNAAGKGAQPGAKPGAPPEQASPGDPMAVPPAPLQPAAKEVVFSTLTPPPGKDEPLDWYVDVDFSPIIQKDIKPYVEALKVVSEMLPGGPEAQKLLVTLALTAMGVNDIDKVLDRLFPLLPEGAQPSQPSLTGATPPEAPPNPGPGFGMLPGANVQGLKNPVSGEMAESMSPYRVHRFLSVVREATDALDAAG